MKDLIRQAIKTCVAEASIMNNEIQEYENINTTVERICEIINYCPSCGHIHHDEPVVNKEMILNIAHKTCLECRAFSDRRLCGCENGRVCIEIADAIIKAMYGDEK